MIADFLGDIAPLGSRFAIALAASLGVGSVLGFLFVLRGSRSTYATYSAMYRLLSAHGPPLLRYPLRRANSARFFASFVTSQIFGFVMLVSLVVLIALLVAVILYVESGVTSALRLTLAALVGAQLVEITVIRTVLTPFAQQYGLGALLFAVELWYLSVGLIKGFTRLILLLSITLGSFFTPAQCAFPDGKESWDGGHVCFVCYCMQRVEHDKRLLAARQNFAYIAGRARLNESPPSRAV